MTGTGFGRHLARAVGPAHVTLTSDMPLLAVDGAVPTAAVYPGDAAQVAEVMKIARALGLAVTARGGGTAMALGAPPERLDIVLGTHRMGRVLEHEPGDLTTTVEAGITLADLDRVLGEHEQMLPLEAPHADRATIGGVLAANTSGPRRLAYGALRDRLLGIRVVDAHGVAVKGGGKVVKNVAGYDLPKLFIGSLGTLGIIVEASFKLAPRPRAQAALVGGFRKLEEAMEVAQALLSGGVRPVALDLLNEAAMRQISVQADVPSFSGRPYLLALDLGGVPAAVQRQSSTAHRIIAEAGGNSLLVEAGTSYDALWRAIVELGRSGERPAAMITRASLLFSKMASIIHGHEALAESSHLVVALDAHLGSGVLRAAWWAEGEGAADHVMLSEAVPTLRTAVGHLGGTFVVESCPPSLKKAIDVWGPPGPELAIMKRLKEQFDPGRLLSPGRFVGGL